ncbi:UNVERIFIED_CONTAM: hypothetical protein NCL1_31166 [Trichonephila clavipes]
MSLQENIRRIFLAMPWKHGQILPLYIEDAILLTQASITFHSVMLRHNTWAIQDNFIILYHGQVTRVTLEMIPLPPNFYTPPMGALMEY